MSKGDQKYIRSLIAEGEHQALDFKFEISDARKIARTLSAFSNTDGGRLLIGVKDNGRISGIRSDEEFYMVESAASLYSKPPVLFESRTYQIDGKNILEIYIPPVKNKPVYAKQDTGRWMAYIRVGDQNQLATIIQLELWKEEKRPLGKLIEFTRKEEILLRHLKEYPGSSLSKIRLDTGFRRKELVALMIKLVQFDVIKISYQDGNALYTLAEKPGEPG